MTSRPLPDEPLIDAEEAIAIYAEYGIKKTSDQLATERYLGTGARFYKVGKRQIRYTRSLILADIAHRLRGPLKSTSDDCCCAGGTDQ
jgi:hypothetical protein